MKTVKPTQTKIENSVVGDSREDHPAYGMIGASRVVGGEYLAGSEFLHQNYVVVRIHGAHVNRDLSNDWWHADKVITEVAMSEAQWATFVSSMNVGNGVPCTLQVTQLGGRIPGIEQIENKSDLFSQELGQTMTDAMRHLHEALELSPNKRIAASISAAIREIEANVPFVSEQFRKTMEKSVERAKAEVNAYITGAIQRAGISALKDDNYRVLTEENTKPSKEK